MIPDETTQPTAVGDGAVGAESVDEAKVEIPTDAISEPVIAAGSDTVGTEPAGEVLVAEPTPISNPVVSSGTPEVLYGAEPTIEPKPEESIPPVLEPKIETPIITTSILQSNTINPTPVSEPVPTPVTNPVAPSGASRESIIDIKFKANMARAKELLIKANNAIQFKRKKRLEKIMTLFDKKHAPTHIGNQIGVGEIKIKNADVRDLLHVSDPTATNYLEILIKEGKIKREGKNKGVYYTKN